MKVYVSILHVLDNQPEIYSMPSWVCKMQYGVEWNVEWNVDQTVFWVLIGAAVEHCMTFQQKGIQTFQFSCAYIVC